MRRVLLAVLLLTGSLAGCAGDSEETVTAKRPDWPTGLVFTYDITADGESGEETFLVHNGTPKGTDLLAWNLSRPNFTSPLLTFDEQYNLRTWNWSGALRFPIEAGDTYTGRLGSVQANISWQEVPHEGPLDIEKDLEGVAYGPEGDELATFRFSAGEVTVLTYAEFDTPDGRNQTWELTEASLNDRWDQPPVWKKGDWWTYTGSFRDAEGTSKIVYTDDRKTRQSQQYVLTPVEVENRVLMLPFQGWRKSDIAPQSGYVSGMISSFWDWPLWDGKTWSGSTNYAQQQYQAVSDLTKRSQLPDGTVTTTFQVEVYVPNEEKPFATYEYSPWVGHLVDWQIRQSSGGPPSLNYTLEDWGEAYHGKLEIPQRALVAEIPITGGPDELNRSFELPDQAHTLQISTRSFAVHQRNVDPVFDFRLTDPNGTLVFARNASDFEDRRLDLSGLVDAQPGTWELEVELGEGVSVLARLFGIWHETKTVDFR